MKSRFSVVIKRILHILIIATLSFGIDYLTVVWTNDDSIWLGQSINVVGAILCGPVVGGIATLLSCIATDYLTYHSFEYIFVWIFEALSVTLIGIIYRSLNKDEDKFGVREIVIFNFVQILVNICVLYLATPPAAVVFFGFITEKWSLKETQGEMVSLGNNTFSACISIALIGTVMLAACLSIRKRCKEYGSISAALKSIMKLNFIKKEYRTRAAEYSVGIFFAIMLTMVDGVVSGHILGVDALAATSVLFPLISFSTFVSNIITTGCSTNCAIAKGSGDYEKSRNLFSMGFFATVVLGLMQTLLFFCLQDGYFKFYTTTSSIAAFAKDYYQVYIFVPPFMAMATFLDEMVSSDGDDALSYSGYLSSFFVNVGLSVLLSKTIGMRGLALGTLLSYVCYILVVSLHFLKKSNTYKLRPWFSIKEIWGFIETSLKTNTVGICMFAVSATFTKSILMFFGNEYLIANTVLCAMLEVYEMINGPSEAAEYLFATYSGERNAEGIKTLFKESLSACLFGGMLIAGILLLAPNTLLMLYGIEDTPFRIELIKCIRYCAVGAIAASVGGFLNDYYGNTGKPLWACIMIIFRVALFPIWFCVTFSLEGGIVAMGIGMLLSQIFAIAVFYGFVFIVKGGENIPYMLDGPNYDKVYMNSFDYEPEEYERISSWITDTMKTRGIDENKIKGANELLLSLFEKTQENNAKKKVLGECVLRFIDEPEIIIKDNGKLFNPDIPNGRIRYNVLMSCNSNTITVL